MAAEREKRYNAGNRLAKLLNEEEDDEFYKTTYGGFEELENDVDYQLVKYFLRLSCFGRKLTSYSLHTSGQKMKVKI